LFAESGRPSRSRPAARDAAWRRCLRGPDVRRPRAPPRPPCRWPCGRGLAVAHAMHPTRRTRVTHLAPHGVSPDRRRFCSHLRRSRSVADDVALCVTPDDAPAPTGTPDATTRPAPALRAAAVAVRATRPTAMRAPDLWRCRTFKRRHPRVQRRPRDVRGGPSAPWCPAATWPLHCDRRRLLRLT